MLRERVTGEITPASAEQSASLEDDETNHGAGLAIDMDLGTSNTAVSTGLFLVDIFTGREPPWLKVNLGMLHCIQHVIMYDSDGNSLLTWTCRDEDCGECDGGNYCDSYTITVTPEDEIPVPSSISDCKFGDSVKVDSNEDFSVPEIAIIEKQGKLFIYG